jgi:AcrR family transcriptional regulator
LNVKIQDIEHSMTETNEKTEPKVKDLSGFTARQRVMAAALKLFVEQGYFNTNVPDLSRESQCSVGSIYHNFKNKEEIAVSLYNEGLKSFRSALEYSIDDCNEIEVMTKQIVKSLLEFSEVNVQLSKFMWLCRHDEFMTGVIKPPTIVGFDSLGRKLTKAFKQGMKSGKIKSSNAQVIWSVVFGLPLGYVRDWLAGYNKSKPSEIADELAEMSWKALSL